MTRKLRFGTVAVLVFALLGTGASASGPRDKDDDDIKIVRVTEIIVQEAEIDLGEPGDSLGDQFVTSSDLFRAGERVGVDGVVCTIVRLEPMVSATAQCVATAEFRKGQITVQGLLTFSEETEGDPFRLAITGGTGKYKEAHGELKVVEVSETESQLTFKIID